MVPPFSNWGSEMLIFSSYLSFDRFGCPLKDILDLNIRAAQYHSISCTGSQLINQSAQYHRKPPGLGGLHAGDQYPISSYIVSPALEFLDAISSETCTVESFVGVEARSRMCRGSFERGYGVGQ